MVKSSLEKKLSTNKNFSYKKGNVELSFTLNTDNTSQLSDFYSCLNEAINDVGIELEGEKN
jgi:hypothetical protein